MTPTTAIVTNAALAVGIWAALALVLRLAHRIGRNTALETLHPSQPLELALVERHNEERDLALAA